ncbi:hypothetical protein OIO90_002653 [Microbotryomycetes sp. JL221]|nr:hypothetical protein OIO90_002653 [Microbotryomycetes sp. JL221]
MPQDVPHVLENDVEQSLSNSLGLFNLERVATAVQDENKSADETLVAATDTQACLLWTEGGWDAGHFAFDDSIEPGADEGLNGVRLSSDEASSVDDDDEARGARKLRRIRKHLSQYTHSVASSTVGQDEAARQQDALDDSSNNCGLTSASLPLTLHVETDFDSFAPFSSAFQQPSSVSSSPITAHSDILREPWTQGQSQLRLQHQQLYERDHAQDENGDTSPIDWALDHEGNLVNADNRYELADEILNLQTDAPHFKPTIETFPYRTSPSQSRLSALDKDLLRRRSEPAALGPSINFRSQTAPDIGFNDFDYYQDRSTIVARHRASDGNFGGHMTPLQTYFAAPIPTSPWSSRNRNHYVLPPPPTPPLTPGTLSTIAQLPLQTDPEDILYTTARETFVDQSLAANAIPASPTSRQAMMAHFDKAMHASHPLASLYGLSTEAAEALAANPSSSGVSESVLRLALIRERQTQAAGAPGLPGPSPNNRKLALYKTELCRSWEEKGSCRYGVKCQFAHGSEELRVIERHPKFKSEICRTFWLHGSCQYGRRCCFIHTSVPGGAAAMIPNIPTPKTLDINMLKTKSSVGSFDSVDVPSSGITDTGFVIPKAPSSLSLSLPRGLGEHLSEFLQPASDTRSSTSSGTSSPVEINRVGSSGSRSVGSGTSSNRSGGSGSVLANLNFVSPLSSIGVKPPGRFTNNPHEVPPSFQEPQSRLKRLASLPSPSSPSPSSPSPTTTRTVTPLVSPPLSASLSYPGDDSSVSSPSHSRHPSISSFWSHRRSSTSVSSFSGSVLAPLTPIRASEYAAWESPDGSQSKLHLNHICD